MLPVTAHSWPLTSETVGFHSVCTSQLQRLQQMTVMTKQATSVLTHSVLCKNKLRSKSIKHVFLTSCFINKHSFIRTFYKNTPYGYKTFLLRFPEHVSLLGSQSEAYDHLQRHLPVSPVGPYFRKNTKLYLMARNISFITFELCHELHICLSV